MEAAVGIEPTHRGFADPGLTTWLRRHYGAGDGIWTRDLYLGKVELYHWATPARTYKVYQNGLILSMKKTLKRPEGVSITAAVWRVGFIKLLALDGKLNLTEVRNEMPLAVILE